MKRERYPMPEYIRQALDDNNVISDYEARPEYQKNDYIGWIERAKRQETKEKRLKQMIDELKIGGIYMKMKHPASIKNKS
ncbi:YdeI/OmpD-associated family protein [methane-oxidizing endosymbiont of Gigantopelta aegis]|uniref:YdeI/OmpD-associated family protein n=1 Tax=methane-oxidizing endosymbiont of Gigantopelta aegis TaxID=2794938 RepID=UPI001FDA12EA|nr:YdeI/OmpD-associated family protein [methane-oxidizing endosymbiont of Gigantopelta aegis]